MSDYDWEPPDNWDDVPPLDMGDLFPPDWDLEPPADFDPNLLSERPTDPAPLWGGGFRLPEGMDWDAFKTEMIPDEQFEVLFTNDDPALLADFELALTAAEADMLGQAEADFFSQLDGNFDLSPEEYADFWDTDLVEPELDLDALFAESCAIVELDPTPAPTWEESLAKLHLTPQSQIQMTFDTPPFIHEESQALVWFGVLQPDLTQPENCMMGVLAVREMTADAPLQVDFAECTRGDYEKCYAQAELMNDVADEYGVNTALETALGLALETQSLQHRHDQQWGTTLPEPTAQPIRNTLEWEL